jgi:uncharacterized protein YyaL (SSP411 family)
MMLASFAEAAAILDREDYLEVARRNARFVLENLRSDGLLLRTYKDGKAKLNAYLEDYAFLADGLFTLYEVSGELEWLEETLAIVNKMIEEFWDDQEGGFFYTGKSHEALIVRSKDYFDNATPSGNSVAAEVLLQLATLTDNEDYRRRAVSILRQIAEPMRRYPSGFGRSLCALDFHLGTPKEIAIIGDPELSETRALRQEVWSHYVPNKVLAHAVQVESGSDLSRSDQSRVAKGPNAESREGESQTDVSRGSDLIPLLRDRNLINGRPTAYVCEHYICREPVTEPAKLASQLVSQRISSA